MGNVLLSSPHHAPCAAGPVGLRYVGQQPCHSPNTQTSACLGIRAVAKESKDATELPK